MTPEPLTPRQHQIAAIRSLIEQDVPSVNAGDPIRLNHVAWEINEANDSLASLEYAATDVMLEYAGYEGGKPRTVGQLLLDVWNLVDDRLEKQRPEALDLVHFILFGTRC